MYFDNYDNEMCFQCLDETDSFGNSDSIFGIGSQKKKAEKKIKKAAKKLEAGQTGKAQRKLEKGQKILGKIELQQQKQLATQQRLADINATQEVIRTYQPNVVESMQTAPGQIGTEAGATVTSQRAAATSTNGGGGGDITATGGYTPMEDMESTSGGETGLTPATAKELQGVTVKSPKDNTMLYVIIGVVVLLAIFFLPKLLKQK